MFEIKYEFKKSGEEYFSSYPLPQDRDNSIFLVKGTNDQGKSTLMQMIALGLHGLDSDDIDENLKGKMRRLVSKDVDRCKFDLNICSFDNQTIIHSELEDTHSPKVTVNGSVKPKDFVLKNFKILYDVPENPMKKFSDSLKLMGDHFKEYEDYLSLYNERIGDVIQKIDEYDRKEESLNKTKQSQIDFKSRLENLQNRQQEILGEYQDLEKNVIVFSYYDNLKKINELSSVLATKKGQKKELKDHGHGGGSTKFRRSFSQALDHYNTLKLGVEKAQKIKKFLDPDDKKKLDQIISKFNSVALFDKKIERDILSCRLLFEEIAETLRGNKIFQQDLPEERESELFEKLIKTLDEFIEFNITIPGTEGKTISKFIQELKKEQKEKARKTSAKSEIKENIDLSENIIETSSELIKLIPIINKSDDNDSTISLHEIENEIKSLEKELADLAVQQSGNKIFHTIPEDQKLKILSEESKYDEFKKSEREKREIEEKIGKIESQISTNEVIIKKLERIEKPCKVNREKLEKCGDIIAQLLIKIRSWRNYIKKIDNERMDLVELKDSKEKIDLKFFDALGDYFAGIVKQIYRKHEEFKLIKIDIINKKYIVEGRGPIHFNDMGTGHSALASLLTKLRTDFPGKKKIVLFDEISDMDSKNVKILLEEIKKQVAEGKILFALLTEKDDTLEKATVIPIKLG
jgi:hypothetical protein